MIFRSLHVTFLNTKDLSHIAGKLPLVRCIFKLHESMRKVRINDWFSIMLPRKHKYCSHMTKFRKHERNFWRFRNFSKTKNLTFDTNLTFFDIFLFFTTRESSVRISLNIRPMETFPQNGTGPLLFLDQLLVWVKLLAELRAGKITFDLSKIFVDAYLWCFLDLMTWDLHVTFLNTNFIFLGSVLSQWMKIFSRA